MSTHPTAFNTSPQGNSHELPMGLLLGNYKILKTIGRGGFGITYLAKDEETGEEVVIKENLPSFYALRDQTSLTVTPLGEGESTQGYRWALERFLDEAKTLAKLDHPNIVKVLKAFSALGTAYYVMPVVNGGALSTHAPAPEQMTEAWLTPILKKLLRALSYLHNHSLLHRDLKPANILLDSAGEPIIIDFGTARSMISERSQTMIGTPGFTPVEQMQNKGNTGPWTDIYALGATCYRLITGQNPPNSLDRLGQDSLRPLRARPELRERFTHPFLIAVDKALAMQLEHRWLSADEWLQALENPTTASLSSSCPVTQKSSTLPQIRNYGEGETATETHQKRSKAPMLITTAAAALLLTGGGAGAFWYMQEQEKARLAQEHELALRLQAEAERRAEAERLAQEEARRIAQEQAEAKRQAEEEAARKAQEEKERLALQAECQSFMDDFEKEQEYFALPRGWRVKQLTERLKSSSKLLPALQEKAQSNPKALYTCAFIHLFGMSVDKNTDTGLELLKQAAEKGYAPAQAAYGAIHQEGRLVEYDANTAFKWFNLAAEQKNPAGLAHTGYAYQYGYGVNADSYKAKMFYQEAIDLDNPEALYFMSQLTQNIELGSGKEGLDWLKQAADKGYPMALLDFGKEYMSGDDIPKDKATGEAYLRRCLAYYEPAYEYGDPYATAIMGVLHCQGHVVLQNDEKGIELFKKSADANCAYGMMLLGVAHMEGKLGTADSHQAFLWLKKASDRGLPLANFAIASLLYEKKIHEQDQAAALLCVRKAADQGDSTAQFILGMWYSDSDKNKAKEFYEKAAKQGNPMAQVMLAIAYMEAKDYKQSEKWALLAAKQEPPLGMTLLFALYWFDESPLQDRKKAIDWLTKAANAGDAAAQYQLACMHLNGNGVKKDYKLGFKYCSLSAEQGNAEGQCVLAICYENGYGTSKNRSKAIEWYKKSAKQGNKDAQQRLKALGKRW